MTDPVPTPTPLTRLATFDEVAFRLMAEADLSPYAARTPAMAAEAIVRWLATQPDLTPQQLSAMFRMAPDSLTWGEEKLAWIHRLDTFGDAMPIGERQRSVLAATAAQYLSQLMVTEPYFDGPPNDQWLYLGPMPRDLSVLPLAREQQRQLARQEDGAGRLLVVDLWVDRRGHAAYTVHMAEGRTQRRASVASWRGTTRDPHALEAWRRYDAWHRALRAGRVG
ncbi:hypothetical protein JNJ66_05790 [Candidatus Saccharibacteria bacterium]|nr:hypothetical protein [Candidatus Saccharibacteria bacterium]